MNITTLIHRRRRASAAIGLVAALAFVLALPAGRVAAEHPPEYLALGDSVTVGVGASDPETTAFVPLFGRFVAARLSPGQSTGADGAQATGSYFRTANLGVGGETSATLISNGQLDAAVAALVERNQNASTVDDIEVITLGIGGNDLTPLFQDCPSVSPEDCLAEANAAITAFAGNFGYILGTLRAAAGPDTPIVVMTYYNPLQNPACPLTGLAPLADQVLAALNATITAVAGTVPNVAVADVAGSGIASVDLQPDCLHPNDSGYQKIADAFAAAYAGV